MTRSCLYVGHLVHVRRDAIAQRTFRYPMYAACLELDELPVLHERLRLFSYNRPNLFALADRDYQGGAAAGVAAAHRALVDGNGLPAPARTRLITQLRVAGYVFNPVSFFLGHGADGGLTSAVAEVNNNYGGRLRYVLGDAQRVVGGGDRVDRFRHVKELFVSPFLHGPASYDFAFDVPPDGDRMDVRMDVRDPAGDRIFLARLTGQRVPLDDRALARAAVRYPFMTLQVIGLIYYEALRLHLAGAPYRRPGADQRPTDPPVRAARNLGARPTS